VAAIIFSKERLGENERVSRNKENEREERDGMEVR